MTRRGRSLLLVAVGVFFGLSLPSAGIAAGISRIDGTISNGNTLTISGTGFGTKPNARPLYFWDFGSSTALWPLSRGAYTGSLRGALSTDVVAPGSRTALKADVAGIAEAWGPTDGVPFNSNTLYVWAKKYYGFHLINDAAANGLNLKFFRLWNPWTHDIYTGYQAARGIDSGNTMPEVTQELSLWWQVPHESSKWITDEWEYRSGSVGVADGVLNYTRGGRSAYPRSSRFTMKTSAHTEGYSLLFFDQISNNQLSPGKYLYFDSIYVDDTWQRVVISDEATWQSVVWKDGGVERKREVQLPLTWSDTSIQIQFRQGSLTDLSKAFVYIIGADGNPVNLTGFPLNGAAPRVPNSPTAMVVQ